MRAFQLSRIAWIRWPLGALASGALVLGVMRAESEWRELVQRREAEKLVRQVLVQAESLVLLAKRDGEADPIAFSARLLSQGNDPRVIRVTPLAESEGVREWPESLVRGGEGSYFGRKRSYPEEGRGFEVQVQSDPVYFLGLPTKLQGDLAAAALAVSWFLAIGFFLRSRARPAQVEMSQRPSPSAAASDETRDRALELAREATAVLRSFTLSARDLIRDAHRIAASISESRAATSALREGLHGELAQAQSAREDLKRARGFTERNETLLLNLMLEASQMGEKGKRLSAMAQEFHSEFRDLRETTRRAEEALLAFERALEPRVTDADQIHHSIEAAMTGAEAMDAAIEGTKRGILDQARALQALEKDLNGKAS